MAPDHNMDTAGYLHVNNPNTRNFLDRMIPLCNMTDIWRQKNPQARQFTFFKRQTNHYTRARLDYFLLNESITHLVKKTGIGKVSTLSDHKPIFLHITLSKTQKGRGFWRFNNDLLSDPKFIFGCNNVIKKPIISYSEYKHCRATAYPPDHEIPSIPSEISYTLLHDVILMECRAYTLKYQSEKRKETIKKGKRINDEIEELINSDDPDDMRKVNLLKEEAQELEDEQQENSARKYFAKLQLEGEKPMKFFCKMNEKQMEKAQFEELHIVEKKAGGEEQIRIVTEQKSVEWTVRSFYWKLYQEEEKDLHSVESSIRAHKEEILKNIKNINKVNEDDKVRMDAEITEEEVGITLKNTRNKLGTGYDQPGFSFYLLKGKKY